jgi:cell division protein FtsZ
MNIQGAKGVLFNITGSSDLGLHEINEAASLIQESADEHANIIFGSVIDDSLGDEVVVTVVATGFEKNKVHEVAPARLIESSMAIQKPVMVETKTESMFLGEEVAVKLDDDLDTPAFMRHQKNNQVSAS